nr:GNAT family N-acetyltransferase [Marinobacter daepoensis]
MTEAEFFSLQVRWDTLLGQSNADPLFMSWAWQVSWWETWGKALSLELLLLAVTDGEDNLVGIAPFYLSAVRTPLGWSVRRVHVVGNAWKLGPTVRTEYVGMIVDRRSQQAVLEALARYLGELDWDEMIFADASARSMMMVESGICSKLGMSRLVRSESEGVVVPVNGAFQDWLARLGKNTRLKVYNRRSLFQSALNGTYEDCQNPGEFLAWLNHFHGQRWGKPCFDEHALRFHKAFLSRLGGGQSAGLSVLKSGGEVVSVLYDIRAGNRIYNLQAGFAEGLHGKVSLGTLHLGYAIEQAFNRPDVLSYDLLAGSGKNTFYKDHFKGERVAFTTVEYVRSPVLKFAYGAKGCLPPSLVSSINRFFRL